jgi:hypothetical protein
MVIRIEVGKNLIARIRGGTEMRKERREEAMDALLCDILEIEIIVSHEG